LPGAAIGTKIDDLISRDLLAAIGTFVCEFGGHLREILFDGALKRIKK